MPQWVWDDVVKRYRDLETGRFLSHAEVMEWVRTSISSASVAADVLAGYAGQGMLAPGDFGLLMREQIKGEYIRQYLLGIGGEAQMTPAHWGRIGGMLSEQYGYLDRFIAEIEAGNLTEAQIRARARMYIQSSREAFERAKRENAKELKMDLEGWFVNPAIENCDDCLALAAKGWVAFGTIKNVPGDGRTQCLTNCGCRKVFKNSKTGNTYG